MDLLNRKKQPKCRNTFAQFWWRMQESRKNENGLRNIYYAMLKSKTLNCWWADFVECSPPWLQNHLRTIFRLTEKQHSRLHGWNSEPTFTLEKSFKRESSSSDKSLLKNTKRTFDALSVHGVLNVIHEQIYSCALKESRNKQCRNITTNNKLEGKFGRYIVSLLWSFSSLHDQTSRRNTGREEGTRGAIG